MNSKKIFATICAVVVMTTVSPAIQQSEVHEIHSLSEISTAHLPKGTLIILDLDENILIDERHTYIDIKCLDGATKTINGARYMPIEKNIADIIANIRATIPGNSVVLAVTKRPYAKEGQPDKAHHQVQELQIPISTKRYQKLNGTCFSKSNPNIIYDRGVLYTAGENKGIYLDYFLNEAGLTPTCILMSDDKKENLEDVYNIAKARKIPMKSYLMIGASRFVPPLPFYY